MPVPQRDDDTAPADRPAPGDGPSGAGSPVLAALEQQFAYDGVDTCAVDGSCMEACPVAIDTGKLIKAFRRERHGEREERGAEPRSRGATALSSAPPAVGVRVGGGVARRVRAEPPAEAAPGQLPFTVREGAAAVYMPSCINRIFGNAAGADPHPTLPEALVAVSRRAGLPLWIPDDVTGHCCGVPWSSKGFAARPGRDGARGSRARSALVRRWRAPVVVDASSCSHGLITEVAPRGRRDPRFDRLGP